MDATPQTVIAQAEMCARFGRAIPRMHVAHDDVRRASRQLQARAAPSAGRAAFAALTVMMDGGGRPPPGRPAADY
jgi:hypothetical protein